MAICLAGLTPTAVAAESTPNAAAPLQLAMFRGDITPPVGEGACIGFMPKVVKVEHPFEARGIILRRGGDTWALVALDYFGPDSIFHDRGGYEQSWSFTGPCQRDVKTALTNLLSPFIVQK